MHAMPRNPTDRQILVSTEKNRGLPKAFAEMQDNSSATGGIQVSNILAGIQTKALLGGQNQPSHPNTNVMVRRAKQQKVALSNVNVKQIQNKGNEALPLEVA